MPTFWSGGAIQIGYAAAKDDLIDTVKPLTFGPHLRDGDTIVRWFIEWYLITSLHENSTTLDVQAAPWSVAVWFTPNYTAFESEVDTSSPLEAEAGDAIYVERTKWSPVRWTDGTLHSTQWWAGSPGVVDIQSERTFQNASSDAVFLGAESMYDQMSTPLINVTVSGWIRAKVLIKR